MDIFLFIVLRVFLYFIITAALCVLINGNGWMDNIFNHHSTTMQWHWRGLRSLSALVVVVVSSSSSSSSSRSSSSSSSNYIAVFRSEAESQQTCRGTIPVADAVVQEHGLRSFVVSCNRRAYYLRALSTVDRDSWVRAIRHATSQARAAKPCSA